jgi:hypothetical protein
MPGAHPQISTISLRTRVAALLATDDDAGKALFDDVGQLYGLRSRIVHGGQIKQKDLRKVIARISTVPEDAAEHFGIALGYAVDRMRDLVRRAILGPVSSGRAGSLVALRWRNRG